MDILIVTPAAADSRSGNRTTATRWRKIFDALGHNVRVVEKYHNQPADLMVAIHAWRSAEAIQQFSKNYPASGLIVVLSGTDAYRFIHSHPQETLNSLRLADRLVGLHAKIFSAIPEEYHSKIKVIYQSAQFQPRQCSSSRHFNICVAGHLRAEKDPLRPALATRNLPACSHIRINHYGKAHNNEWAQQARMEEATNRRYRWHGEVTQAFLRSVMQKSQLLVLPSIMEGGANIITEALALNLPVLASRIDGSVGLLGEHYPGYFETGNTQDLCRLLNRVEQVPIFYRELERACRLRQPRFHPANEKHGWKLLINEIKTRPLQH